MMENPDHSLSKVMFGYLKKLIVLSSLQIPSISLL